MFKLFTQLANDLGEIVSCISLVVIRTCTSMYLAPLSSHKFLISWRPLWFTRQYSLSIWIEYQQFSPANFEDKSYWKLSPVSLKTSRNNCVLKVILQHRHWSPEKRILQIYNFTRYACTNLVQFYIIWISIENESLAFPTHPVTPSIRAPTPWWGIWQIVKLGLGDLFLGHTQHAHKLFTQFACTRLT